MAALRNTQQLCKIKPVNILAQSAKGLVSPSTPEGLWVLDGFCGRGQSVSFKG